METQARRPRDLSALAHFRLRTRASGRERCGRGDPAPTRETPRGIPGGRGFSGRRSAGR